MKPSNGAVRQERQIRSRLVRVLAEGALFAVVVWAALATAADAGSVTTAKYGYDARGQLKSADYGTSGKVTYQYDQAGNLVVQKGTAPAGAPKTQGLSDGGLFDDDTASADAVSMTDSSETP